MFMCVNVTVQLWRSEGILESRFCPSTITCVPGIKLRLQGAHSKCAHPMNHRGEGRSLELHFSTVEWLDVALGPDSYLLQHAL